MKASKEKYIEEVKTVMHHQLSMHFITDIDEELAPMLEDIDLDFEDYYEARRKGNIIRIDDHLVMWLNGITCAWVLLNYPEKTPAGADLLTREEIIPNFEKVYNSSRLIAIKGNHVFLGEYCRLQG